MNTVATLQTSRVSGAQYSARPARANAQRIVCSAQARPEAPKQQKAALAALAAFAAAVLVSAPAPAHADVKSTVCASIPTAKVCLKNSAKQ